MASNPEDPETLERIKGVTLDRILPLRGRQRCLAALSIRILATAAIAK
jgi:hypothetical protein